MLASKAQPPSVKRPRLAILFHRLGPYHHARVRAAASLGDVIAVETVPVDATYAWQPINGSQGFRKVTLFLVRETRPHSMPEVTRRVSTVLNDAEPSVVAIPGWSDLAALAALRWARGRGVPVVLMTETAAENAMSGRLRNLARRAVVRHCSAALVGGRRSRDFVVTLGMPVERVQVGYDVVDNHHFETRADVARRRATVERERLRLPGRFFLASGRFIAVKNFSGLLHAFAGYRAAAGAQGWSLVLLGDGDLRSALEHLAHELGIADKVVLPGFKQYDELPTYYGLASAFIHCSTVEAWGLVVNEAMATGLPVIVSNRCGCAPDLVEEGVNGFTFDPRDTGRLVSLMLKVAGGECDLGAMGQASWRMIGRWSLELFARSLWNGAATATGSGMPEVGLLDRALFRALLAARGVAPKGLAQPR
jgi:glycosyltransferase involved in cell wall biosynthesis